MEYSPKFREELLDQFEQILESVNVIKERLADSDSVDVLFRTPWGMTTLDACIMRLQVIGELVRAINSKTEGTLFAQYPAIPWKSVIGMRNFISHEYANIDYDMIWKVFSIHLPQLEIEVEKIMFDLKNIK